MAVRIYGELADNTHENKMLQALCDQLSKSGYGEGEQDIYLIANTFWNGAEIDLVLIQHNSFIVADLKDYSGRLSASENGAWTMESDDQSATVYGGNQTASWGGKSPFKQIRENRFSVINFLSENGLFTHEARAHISALVVFNKLFSKDLRFSHGISKWLFVSDLDDIANELKLISSHVLKVDPNDVKLLIKALGVKSIALNNTAASNFDETGSTPPKDTTSSRKVTLIRKTKALHDVNKDGTDGARVASYGNEASKKELEKEINAPEGSLQEESGQMLLHCPVCNSNNYDVNDGCAICGVKPESWQRADADKLNEKLKLHREQWQLKKTCLEQQSSSEKDIFETTKQRKEQLEKGAYKIGCVQFIDQYYRESDKPKPDVKLNANTKSLKINKLGLVFTFVIQLIKQIFNWTGCALNVFWRMFTFLAKRIFKFFSSSDLGQALGRVVFSGLMALFFWWGDMALISILCLLLAVLFVFILVLEIAGYLHEKLDD